jgi:hypothetical protein
MTKFLSWNCLFLCPVIFLQFLHAFRFPVLPVQRLLSRQIPLNPVLRSIVHDNTVESFETIVQKVDNENKLAYLSVYVDENAAQIAHDILVRNCIEVSSGNLFFYYGVTNDFL